MPDPDRNGLPLTPGVRRLVGWHAQIVDMTNVGDLKGTV
jgi:hypothetical protein